MKNNQILSLENLGINILEEDYGALLSEGERRDSIAVFMSPKVKEYLNMSKVIIL
jgi:hypothetical protein